MLLAFSALPEELQVLLISVTYGNIDLQNCLRNVVSLFYHVEKEIAWRSTQGRKLGFDSLRNSRPSVAVGPEYPLAETKLMADYFRKCVTRKCDTCRLTVLLADGMDGLGGIHDTVSDDIKLD